MVVCVLKKHVRFGERAATTVVDGVGQSHGLQRVNHCQVEDGLHGGLVEAGERLPGVSGLHLCGGQDSVQNTEHRTQSEIPEVRDTIRVVARILSRTQHTVRETRRQTYYLGGGPGFCPKPRSRNTVRDTRGQRYHLCGATLPIIARPEQSEISAFRDTSQITAVTHTAVRDAKLADIPVLARDTSREIPVVIDTSRYQY